MKTIKYKIRYKNKISKPMVVTNGKKNVVFLPSTHLKDKNGVEIYENDVIKISQDIGNVKAGYYIVVYHNGCFMITRDQELNYMEHYLWFVTDHCEVVKNVSPDKDDWQKLKIETISHSHFF